MIDEADIAETWETDLLICGAGNGGMMAASVAADNGIDFRVIEQNSVVGDTRHWYGAVNTSAAKEAGVEVDVAKLRSEASRYTSGKMDQRVFNVWLNESAAMHDYVAPLMEAAGCVLEFSTDKEVETEHHTQYYCPPQQHYWASTTGERVSRKAVFEKHINELGYYIDFNHSLVEFTKEGKRVK